MRLGLGPHQVFEEARQKFQKPSCFNFSSGADVLLFDFSPAYLFNQLIN